MKLKETVRGIWRSVQAFAYAVEYDEQTDIRLRVERLEQLVTEPQPEGAGVSIRHQPQPEERVG